MILGRYESARAELAYAMQDPAADAAFVNRRVIAFLEQRSRLAGFNPAQASQLVRSLVAEARDREPAAGPLVIARTLGQVVLALPAPTIPRKAQDG